MPPVTGRTINVPAGGNLQQALRDARPGDEIVLAAGAEYRGNFLLPAKNGSAWITVRSSALDQLPAGTRVRPADAAHMARIVGRPDGAPLYTENQSNLWRLAGLEITLQTGTRTNYGLLRLGSGEETSFDQLTSDIIVDRSYIHGLPLCDCVRGVVLQGARQAVIDSHITEIHSPVQDSQAIAGFNGPGPFKISNNYLEAAGENIMFGGTDPKLVFRGVVTGSPTTTTAVLRDMPPLDSGMPLMFTIGGTTGSHSLTTVREVDGDQFTFDPLPQPPDAGSPVWFGVVPSDIEVTRNTFFKPLHWKADDPSFAGTAWVVKNLLELKSAQRVLVEGNWFENSWVAGQSGIGLLITSTNQDGNCPYCITQDVIIRNNVVSHTFWALVILGRQSGNKPALQPAAARRIALLNNLFYPSQRLFSMLNGPRDIVIEHNTGFSSSNTLVTDAEGSNVNGALTMTGNLLERSQYGISGAGKEGVTFLTETFTPLVFRGNGIINTSSATDQAFGDDVLANRYGPANIIFSSLARVRFVRPSFTNRDFEGFALAPNSPALGRAPDGGNLGADIAALAAALPKRLF